jgi:diguanylate cyclase (GGDEF)-like protein/PAS domain S-box-containing protein
MSAPSQRASARSLLSAIPLARRYRLLLAAIVLGGAALSIAAFLDVRHGELDAARRDFDAGAELRLIQLQQEIDATLDAVETLATFFESSREIEPAEFSRFADGLFERMPTVRALNWIEYVPAAARRSYETRLARAGGPPQIWEPANGGRVPAQARAVHYPVRYIAADDDSAQLTGFDVGFEVRRREALVLAARSGQTVATQPLSLVVDEVPQPAVLVLRPVYGDQPGSPLRGFTGSAIAIADLVDRVHSRLGPRPIDFRIYERTASGRGSLLYAGATPADGAAKEGLVHDGVLHIAGRIWEVEFVPTRASGLAGSARVSAAWVLLAGGLLATAFLFFYVRALYRSTLATHRTGAALRLRDRAIEASTNAIVIVRTDCEPPTIEYVNAAFERITGYPREEVVGRDWHILHDSADSAHRPGSVETMLRADEESEVLLRSRRRNGVPFWNSLHMAPVRDDGGRQTHVVAIIEDVTENKSYQEQLEHQATHDVLTGLPNRALLLDRIAQAIAHARRNDRMMALIFVDVDHFKRINDGYGHSVGDRVLCEVATRISSVLRGDDTVARYAGDEFVILLNDQISEKLVEQFCRRLCQAIAEPMMIDERELVLSASIGISLFPRDGGNAETLLQNADTAMYRVKDEGRGGTRFFTKDIGSEMHQRLTLEQSLRRALERGEFMLEYQPRVNLADGTICGVEALVRWERPGHGRVPPAEFIGLAEDTGLIVPIGEWVLETACREAAGWTDGRAGMAMSVNLSPRQFRQHDLVALIDRALGASGLSPARLELEVTESTMMHDVQQATGTLRGLSELGVRLALDDFGTGYSSLAYLKTFPIDDLKIDRSFVRDVVHDQEDAQIARAIIGLARTLGLRVVAEGVENADQLRFLCEHGCDEGQGFLFARPLAADALARWVVGWDPGRFEFSVGDRGRVIPLRR